MEARRGRRGQTLPGEERCNETGKVAIAHGSVEFCEATPIGLADESWESLSGCETDRDHLLRNACVAPRHVDASRDLFFIFYFFLRTNSAGVGGGERCQTFYFSFFPFSADHEREWPSCKVVFFGLATNMR